MQIHRYIKIRSVQIELYFLDPGELLRTMAPFKKIPRSLFLLVPKGFRNKVFPLLPACGNRDIPGSFPTASALCPGLRGCWHIADASRHCIGRSCLTHPLAPAAPWRWHPVKGEIEVASVWMVLTGGCYWKCTSGNGNEHVAYRTVGS